MFEVVAHFASEHPHITLGKLKEVFPDELQGSHGVVEALDAAHPDKHSGHKRHFIDSPIKLADGLVAVCSQWRANNFAAFTKKAQELGYNISTEPVSSS